MKQRRLSGDYSDGKIRPHQQFLPGHGVLSADRTAANGVITKMWESVIFPAFSANTCTHDMR